jgi:hypothetical protein
VEKVAWALLNARFLGMQVRMKGVDLWPAEKVVEKFERRLGRKEDRLWTRSE